MDQRLSCQECSTAQATKSTPKQPPPPPSPPQTDNPKKLVKDDRTGEHK
jgi:hypothetical protein